MKNLTLLAFILFSVSCSAEQAATEIKEKFNTTENRLTNNEEIIGSAVADFSKALTTKNADLFIGITDAKSIYIVRKFMSGNLGGRGANLSASLSLASMDKNLAFAIEKQTPVEMPAIFLSLPIKSFSSLPKYSLPIEVETAHFDQWTPLLKSSLTKKPEVETGDSVILHSPSSKFWVYGEAQIIDDIITGGFAVFKQENNKSILVAIIELL